MEGVRSVVGLKSPVATTGWTDLVSRFVVGAAIAVILLGVGRELLVAFVGTGTVLQEGRHFDLDAEASLPAWFSGALLLMSAALAGVFALFDSRDGFINRRPWIFLGAILTLLSLDEVASFHEALLQAVSDRIGFDGPLQFVWLAVVPIVVLLGLFFWRFLSRLPPEIRRRIWVAGALFVSGAIGVEMISGAVEAAGMDRFSSAYRVAVVFEETLEITGLVLLLVALLSYASMLGIRLISRSRG